MKNKGYYGIAGKRQVLGCIAIFVGIKLYKPFRKEWVNGKQKYWIALFRYSNRTLYVYRFYLRLKNW